MNQSARKMQKAVWTNEHDCPLNILGQTPSIKIALNFSFLSTQDTHYLLVSMEGTGVKSSEKGKIKWDLNEIKGWYTEQIDVYMNFDSTEVQLFKDKPDTTSASHTVTSEINQSIEVNKDGPSMGVSLSNSISKELPNFKVLRNSSSHTLDHTYKLASTDLGEYNEPSDLIKKSIGRFLMPTANSIGKLPDLTKYEFSVISQGLWVADSSLKDAEITVRVTQYLKALKAGIGTTALLDLDVGATIEHKEWSYEVKIPVHFSSSTISKQEAKEKAYMWA